MKRIAPRALIVLALAAAAVAAVVAVAGQGASPARASAAIAPSIEVTQDCPDRVEPRTVVGITARIRNDGDALLQVNPVDVVADAGTPENEADDFSPVFQGGDANGNQSLDPGETWAYAGTYTVGDDDTTNVVSAEATAPDTSQVSDLAGCATDVIVTPAPGEQARVSVVKGKVRIRKPGSDTFIELDDLTEIPVGSQVDTTKGTVQLTAGLGGGRTNAANFYDGVFTITQKRAANSYMVLRLDKGNFGLCRRSGSNARSLSSVAAKSKKAVRRLWGSGKGKFTTRGRYSSATVRGTKWLTQDRCDGTLTRVLSGVVLVNDLRKHKNVRVRAGRSYLAKAPGA